MDDQFQQRLEGVERLTKLFRMERMVYLTITLISFVMLVGCALSLMTKNQPHYAELTLLFGSSGAITYTAGRLLYMWNEALKRVMPLNGDGKATP